MKKQFEKPFDFKGAKANLSREEYFELFGFTIFDIIHIAMAVVIIILACVTKGEGYLDEIGTEMLSLIFAIILIGFVDEMAEKEENGHGNRYFTFAWLVCSGALLAPEAFRFPLQVAGPFDENSAVYFVKFGFTCLGMFFFLFSLFTKKHSDAWFLFIVLGVLCIGASIPFSIWSLWIEEEPMIAGVETVSSLAPIAPIVFTFLSFHKKRRNPHIRKHLAKPQEEKTKE